MTGQEAPQRWQTTVPDLHSRLTAVPGIALEAPDEALLARVLLKLFADRQLKLPEALIGYLAPQITALVCRRGTHRRSDRHAGVATKT